MFNLARPVYFYLSYFIAHVHWRLLNYSKAVQSSPVLLPGVYWRRVAEMAERDWLSDCVWVRGAEERTAVWNVCLAELPTESSQPHC